MRLPCRRNTYPQAAQRAPPVPASPAQLPDIPFLPAAALPCRTGQLPGGSTKALDQLAEHLGGPRCLRDCHGADGWPRQGIYFFFEPGEVRADGRNRVVRVGTHALTAASQATLWGRLRQHRGHLGGRHPGGGNHRASVFRRHIGAAIIQRRKLSPDLLDSWLDRHGPRPGHAGQEARIEEATSGYIGAMPILWLAVEQRAGRGYIEHIRHHHEPGFPDLLDQLIHQQR